MDARSERSPRNPPAQIAVVEVSTQRHHCVMDVLYGERWRIPSAVLSSLVKLVDTHASALYAGGRATSDLDAAAGVILVTMQSEALGAAGERGGGGGGGGGGGRGAFPRLERLSLSSGQSGDGLVRTPIHHAASSAIAPASAASASPASASHLVATAAGASSDSTGAGWALVRSLIRRRAPSGWEGRLLSDASAKLPFVAGLALLVLGAVSLCWSRRLRGYSLLLAERTGVSDLLPTALISTDPLKRVTFEFALPRGMQTPGTPRLQPVARVVDVEGVRSVPALRDLLVALATDLPGCSEAGLTADSLDVFLVDAAGRRTRLSGRAQLKALRHTHELHVTVSSGGPTPTPQQERGRTDTHRRMKSDEKPLLTLDDEESMAASSPRETLQSPVTCERIASSESLIGRC